MIGLTGSSSQNLHVFPHWDSWGCSVLITASRGDKGDGVLIAFCFTLYPQTKIRTEVSLGKLSDVVWLIKQMLICLSFAIMNFKIFVCFVPVSAVQCSAVQASSSTLRRFALWFTGTDCDLAGHHCYATLADLLQSKWLCMNWLTLRPDCL